MRLRDPWNSTKILRDPEFLNLTFATPITVSIVMTMMMIMIISQEEVYGGANTSPDVRLDIVARGLWERQRAAFLDVRVCHPNADSCWGFSRDVSKIQTTKLLILLRFYFHDVQEQLKTYSYKFLLWMGSWFCNRLRLNFKAFAWRGIYMTAERTVVLVEK